MKRVKYIGATDAQVKWGNNDDPREILKEGEIYKLASEEIHNWYTKFCLKRFPNMKFNSVCFEEILSINDVI